MARRETIEERQRVIFEREDDGTWTARPASARAPTARGGSIAQARKRVREILRGDDRLRRTRELDVVDEIRLPSPGIVAVERLARAREALDGAEREAVTMLVRRLGLGVREASQALGLTMRRVVHLAGEVADVEAEEKAARRSRRARVVR
ncbi:hypothetical protein [Sandaracinus amylolyticus]|uniref:Uncharacterized protein n=1 Tax=Sandaracinus amylolyticus TaxID=927083 RepID=A0A0F6YKP8_9BACT|nr:hypothetical protein [Sandaracinus amylolyticus]AKF08622.1 hypothetical protein DB32_005771 [Sandaracinus amylolyticus]